MKSYTPALFLGVGLVVAIAGPLALRVASASPQPVVAKVTKASADEFGPVCKAAELVDSRPDPVWVGASYANDHCQAPLMPARLDGYSATREQVVAAMGAQKRYAAQSDSYQRCIADFITVRKNEAVKAGKPIQATLIAIETHRIVASQQNQKTADAVIKAEIEAFNELGSECL